MPPYTATEKTALYAEILGDTLPEFRRQQVIWMAANLLRETVIKAVQRYAGTGAKDGKDLLDFAQVMVM